jgi:cytochrome b subunit of formate dehydrogenase
MDLGAEKFVKRFPWGWRAAHLFFALVTMTLVLTGTSALFADSSWAPMVVKWLGGPAKTGLIHRIAAACFVGVFVIHFVYVMAGLLRSKSFRWFGPDSLIPNWKDLADCVGMFKWFVGKGEKPKFERWTYFEKFDYWAVFWGVNIIGWSGLMLAFPHVTAKYLPGWVFNVATVVHGEEAFLAAVFLFTVHFFNNHFRPDKLPPPDVVMFTGVQSLEEFRRDHRAQYDRLVAAGELEKYLVDEPSRPFTFGSKLLGLVLITIGLTLLVLVSVGFFGGAA